MLNRCLPSLTKLLSACQKMKTMTTTETDRSKTEKKKKGQTKTKTNEFILRSSFSDIADC